METKNINEFFIEKGLFITAIFSILVIFTILAFIVSEAIPAFQSYGFFHFLTGSTWAPNEGQFGVFPMIIRFNICNFTFIGDSSPIIFIMRHIHGRNSS